MRGVWLSTNWLAAAAVVVATILGSACVRPSVPTTQIRCSGAVVKQPDDAGVYIANWWPADSSVVGFRSDGSVVGPTITSPLHAPSGLAFDRNGNVWIANHDLDSDQEAAVVAFDMRGKAPTMIATIRRGISSPHALAFDAQGNLYVANAGDSEIAIYRAAELTHDPAPAQTLSGPDIAAPSALGFDQFGNLWVANVYAGTVVELPGVFPGISNRARVVVSRGLIYPTALPSTPEEICG